MSAMMGLQLVCVVLSAISALWVDTCDSRYNLLEGDIALPTTSSDEKSTTYHPNPTDRDQIKLWKDGLVPYMFSHSYRLSLEYDQDFTEEEKEVIRGALKQISDNVPCVKFR